jgi:hypothetical protein
MYKLSKKVLTLKAGVEDYVFDLPIPDVLTLGQVKGMTAKLENPLDAGFELLRIAGGLNSASSQAVVSSDTVGYYAAIAHLITPADSHDLKLPDSPTNGQIMPLRKIDVHQTPMLWLHAAIKSVTGMTAADVDKLPLPEAMAAFEDLVELIYVPKSGS